MSSFMRKLSMLCVMTFACHASSINQINLSNIEKSSNITESNVINSLWNHTKYEEIQYNEQQNNDMLKIASIIENRLTYKLSPKANSVVRNLLNYFMNSLPRNNIRIFSRDNIISLLKNANKMQCRKKKYNISSKFTTCEDCSLCKKDKLIKYLCNLLKTHNISYGSINEFIEYLIKNNRIFPDIGTKNSRDNHHIMGIEEMPYYNAIHALMQQVYNADENKIKYCDQKILTIVKKCLVIPFLYKFLNNKNTNDLYYRVNHYPNSNYNVILFFNDLSEDSYNNSLILSIEVYDGNILCKMKEFYKLYDHKLESYRQSRKNTEEQK